MEVSKKIKVDGIWKIKFRPNQTTTGNGQTITLKFTEASLVLKERMDYLYID